MCTAAAVIARKKALRTSLKDTLKSISPSEIQYQSGLVFSHITSHPAFLKARVVACYLSMPSGELDTVLLVRSILEAGKILFVPRINKNRGEIDMLRVYDQLDLDTLPSGTWGIREPDLVRNGQFRTNITDSGSPILDLVILPGLAFDHTLSRIGHGKGYYDRFLTSYRSSLLQHGTGDGLSATMPLLFGLSLNQQILDPSLPLIPTTDHDWKVDGVFYPRGLISAKPTAS